MLLCILLLGNCFELRVYSLDNIKGQKLREKENQLTFMRDDPSP
jgi:hypothetical protein